MVVLVVNFVSTFCERLEPGSVCLLHCRRGTNLYAMREYPNMASFLRQRKAVLKKWRSGAIGSNEAVATLREMGVKDRHGNLWMISPSSEGCMFGRSDGKRVTLCDLSEFESRMGIIMRFFVWSFFLVSIGVSAVVTWILGSQ